MRRALGVQEIFEEGIRDIPDRAKLTCCASGSSMWKARMWPVTDAGDAKVRGCFRWYHSHFPFVANIRSIWLYCAWELAFCDRRRH